MTTVYFIRHAESDISVRDERTRPLTEKGLANRNLVTDFLWDKNIDAVLSSPFKRTVDTVADFADKAKLSVLIEEDFRERKIDSAWLSETSIVDFFKRQWTDFSYKLSGGECLADVQERNITALKKVLNKYKDKNIVIGTHGTALSTIMNYYDKTYGFDDFMAMVGIMPWIVNMYFDENGCMGMVKTDLFHTGHNIGSNRWRVNIASIGELISYRFVVIFARYKDKWLYCRAKERDAFETAGGKIENGETPLDAARRELYEETGAIEFEIEPVFDYSVHTSTGYSNGRVFFAQIQKLGEMPGFEMAEAALFDTIPKKMRFPQILPVLYERMQAWYGGKPV